MPDPQASSSDRASARRAATALGVFAVAWVWLSLRPSAPLHEDTSRDLAFVRDLVDGAVLHRHGAWASFASLEQGTSWIDFLALCRFAGLGMVGTERVLTTLLAASVALAFLGFAALMPASSPSPMPSPSGDADERAPLGAEVGPLVGALVLLAGLPIVCEMPILWQPILLPVPLVLAHLSLWRLLRDGALVDALALAVFCALAVDVHVVSVAFVAPALAAVPLASKRPLIATPLALAVGFASALLSSWTAVWDDLEVVIERGWLPLVIAVAVAAVVVGVLARPRYARLTWPARLRLALAIEVGALAVLVLASVSDATPSLTGRYLSPFLPAIALACALLEARVHSRRGAMIAIALALALLAASVTRLRPPSWRALPTDPEWRVGQFEPVAAALRRRGLTWTDLIARLQGPSTAVMLGHLSSLLEPGTTTPARPEHGLLLLALTPAQRQSLATELADTSVTTVDIDDDTQALLIHTPARTDRLGAQLCRDGRDCVDVFLAVTNPVYQAHVNAWIEGEPAGKWLAQQGGAGDEIMWRVPVRAGEPVTLVLDSKLPERCAWKVVASEGFEPGAALPASELALPAAAAGALLISRRLGGGDEDRACVEHGLLPPTIVETAPTWTTLRALLTRP